MVLMIAKEKRVKVKYKKTWNVKNVNYKTAKNVHAQDACQGGRISHWKTINGYWSTVKQI